MRTGCLGLLLFACCWQEECVGLDFASGARDSWKIRGVVVACHNVFLQHTLIAYIECQVDDYYHERLEVRAISLVCRRRMNV